MVEPCLNRALWDVIAVLARARNTPDRSVTVSTFATTTDETSFCDAPPWTRRFDATQTAPPTFPPLPALFFKPFARLIGARPDKKIGKLVD